MTTVAAGDGLSTVEIAGVRLELLSVGAGPPLLFLHPGHPAGKLDPAAPVLKALAAKHRVIAPTHPGFGLDPAPPAFTTVDDLAYLYLDLMAALELRDAVLVGVSFGAWIAAEIAIKSCERLSRLVLADALGIKVGDRESRDIADIYAITDADLLGIAYADPEAARRDTMKLSDDELLVIARSREATARYGWQPYLHDPKLKGRLHRVAVPTLVLWGEADRIVRPDLGRAYAGAIPGARFELIERAGHFPHLETPDRFASRVLGFCGE